jgi:hypothetical protein
MGSDTPGLGGTAPGASAEPADGSDDHLIWLPGVLLSRMSPSWECCAGMAANVMWLLVMCCSPMATSPNT